jgi:hypothetical protein
MKCTVETLLSIKETINTIRSEVNTLQKNKSAKIEALHNSNVELQNSNKKRCMIVKMKQKIKKNVVDII